jgi:hypothetical protein
MPRNCRYQQAIASIYCVFALAIPGLGGIAAVKAATPAGEPASSRGIEFFEKNVRPLLVEHCLECHSGESNDGGLSLGSRAGLLRGGDSGAAVVPGSAAESLLLAAVTYQHEVIQMPPEGRLADDEIAVLRRWIEMGLPDPRTDAASETVEPTGMTVDEGRQFWSFQPITEPPLPNVENQNWIRSPIDAFVLHQLEMSGLTPAPPADRRTLIRRVYFDLIGLPPTPREVHAFLDDDSPDAFAKVVDRLLASPAYGVRWGRHWLDVARYADSNGLDENLAFGNAWRYRDYVIESFNEDKPFDRFLIEQLAGDLLPDADRESITATAFLTLGAKVLAEPDREKLAMDTIDEQLDTVGKAFLGMTLGCVRCHDHKFDPLRQEDYYALAAIFKSTRTFADTNTGAIKHWYEHSFANEAELEELKKVDQRISEAKKAASSFKSKQIAELRQQARDRAAEYLAVCVNFSPDASLAEIEPLAQQAGLHPRILHHCRRHLEFHRDTAPFDRWHQLAASGGHAAVLEHFSNLFTAASSGSKGDNEKANGPSADVPAFDDSLIQAARQALKDPSGFLAVPAKPEFAFDAETLSEYHELMRQARLIESRAPDEPATMAVSEAETIAELPIHIRGSHLNLGDPVPRSFPAVMRFDDHSYRFPDDQSGRLQLARWMTDPRHPLTARVLVNRVWGWHFGTGLVSTTENFGVLGDRPSHPTLLDWLARHFVKSGWSIKQLHRTLILSSTYQTRSRHPNRELLQTADPNNRLFSHTSVRRLEAEPIRDSVLFVTGTLERSLGGKTIPLRNRQFVFNHTSEDHTRYDSRRRAVFLPIVRNNLYTFIAQFDYPDPTMPSGKRQTSVVAPQALLMLNSPLVMDAAENWSKQLLETYPTDAERIRSSYETAFSRPPSTSELRRGLAYIATTEEQEKRRRWLQFCQSLLASNEFIYVR